MSNPMDMLDSSAEFAAMMTGMRQQFITLGWTPENAELMVVAMCQLAVEKMRQGKTE